MRHLGKGVPTCAIPMITGTTQVGTPYYIYKQMLTAQPSCHS